MSGVSSPLSEPVFLRVWLSSLLSNLGQHMQIVAAAWAMLELTGRPDLVGLVQTAFMLPVMLFAVAGGAIADMYDRRRVALAALMLPLAGAVLLAVVSATGSMSAALILLACFITGTGVSIFLPAWQASASELVGVKAMPAAVSLNSVASNAARSVGPALGGLLIAVAGMASVFSVNGALYLPIIVTLFLWRHRVPAPRLPPERLDRAMLAGIRFVRYSPFARRILLRSFLTSMGNASIYAMLPVVAQAKLGGGPDTYGLLLGGFGLGAVLSAVVTSRLRARFSAEHLAMASSIILGAAVLVTAFSGSVALTGIMMIFAGAAWTVSISVYNVSVQLASPRWVSGRMLAIFQAAVGAGLAGGSLLWGQLTESYGLELSLAAAGVLLLTTALAGRIMAIPEPEPAEAAPSSANDPLLRLALTGRSGPIELQVEYCVPVRHARSFYHAMRDVRRSRERNGAFATSLARDISDPEIWVERFSFPTWNDYLRARDRPTIEDRRAFERTMAYNQGSRPPKVRRMLERPVGSVRWSEETIDPGEPLQTPVSLSAFGSG